MCLLGVATTSILLYFIYPVALISLSIYSSRSKEVTAEGYFFADRNSHWFPLGISMLAASLFSPYILTFVAPGLFTEVLWVYAIISLVMLAVLSGIIAPRLLEMKVKTLPEFFERRFGKECRKYLSGLYILFNVAIRLLIILAVSGALLSTVGGTDPFSSLLFFLVVTGIYVIIGGLRAEINANIIQFILIVLAIGGFVGWLASQGNGVDRIGQRIGSHFFLGRGNESELSRIGLLAGLPIIGFWFWCADQIMVQKVLSARKVRSVRMASVTAGILQILPFLVFAVLGTMTPMFWRTGLTGFLHALFMNSAFPDSLRGAVVIATVAVFMILVGNIFNGTSSLITFDFFCDSKPEASDRQVVLVGRMSTVALVVISILLIPISQTLDLNSCLQLFEIFSYFSSLIAAVLLAGLLSRKIKGKSTLFTLSAASLIILLRIVLRILVSDQHLGSNVLEWFVNSTFLEFSVFVFVLSFFLLIAIHYLKSKYESSFHRSEHNSAETGSFLPALIAIIAVRVFLT